MNHRRSTEKTSSTFMYSSVQFLGLPFCGRRLIVSPRLRCGARAHFQCQCPTFHTDGSYPNLIQQELSLAVGRLNPLGALRFRNEPDPRLAGVQKLDSSLLKGGHYPHAGIFTRFAALILAGPVGLSGSQTMNRSVIAFLACIAASLAPAPTAFAASPFSTGFTYQGRLAIDGKPAPESGAITEPKSAASSGVVIIRTCRMPASISTDSG